MVDRINNAGLGQSRKFDNVRSNIDAPQNSGKASPTGEANASKPSMTTVDTGVLDRISEEVSASDGIDRAKVEAIKTAIRNGEFAIDAKAVATAFVNLEMMVS